MEHKIGEIFEYNGEWCQCVEGNVCENCAFKERKCYLGGTDDLIGECCYDRRRDNKDVIFKKLEKVGEPYKFGRKLMQKYNIYAKPYLSDDYGYIYIPGRYNEVISIEIKQNKEDMGEKKQKLDKLVDDYMACRIQYAEFDKEIKTLYDKEKSEPTLKKFDLEAAKKGKPVCTRDGRKARIICFDAKGDKPIIALIEYEIDERPCNYFANGRFYSNPNENNDADLMMLPEKKEGWINVYKDSVYGTKDEAIDATYENRGYIDTVKVSWEE